MNKQILPLVPINLIKTCPVVILILNRKAKVKGRIIFLTNSIKLSIGAKYPGEPWGVKWDKNPKNEYSTLEKTIHSQITKDIEKVKTIWVVTPNI